MEELLACVLLCGEGLLPWKVYQERLDARFLEDPDNDLLQELEWNAGDWKGAYARIREYWADHAESIRIEIFGRFFLDRLKEIFRREDLDLRWFGSRMYTLWKNLPPWLQDIQPFWPLSYADDPLFWGDEAQSRSIYQEMLTYYDDQGPEAEM